jgi:MinD-like ATPase involved in chromosome partitioning or flagellar assembly
VSELAPPVLVALSLLVEQQAAALLFGNEAVVTVTSSLVELAAIERTLAGGAQAEALLVSADLPDLSASTLSRARSYGLRVIGIAADQHDDALFRELPLDATLTAPFKAADLVAAVRPPATNADQMAKVGVRGKRRRERQRDATVLAAVGGRGAPGASELACSLAALAATQWQTLLVELDLLGSAGLAVRLGSDAQQGSLLALLRATRSGEPALGELVERWLVSRSGWPPALLGPPHPEQVIDELDQPGAIRSALDALAALYPLVFVDVGFLLSQPGPLGPVERCHREALLAADGVVLVLGAREAQLDAGLAQLDLLLETLELPTDRVRIVCNGVGGPGAIPRTQLEQTLTIALRERELAADALIRWDARAVVKAVRTGLPLAAAHPRGSYAHALQQLLATLFLPGAPITRGRKRLLMRPAPANAAAENESVTVERDEEVALPWRS